jgi:hypothetical protein
MGLREDILASLPANPEVTKSPGVAQIIRSALERSITVLMDVEEHGPTEIAANEWAVQCVMKGVLLPMPGLICFFTGRLFAIKEEDRRQGILAMTHDGSIAVVGVGFERQDEDHMAITVTPLVSMLINDEGNMSWDVRVPGNIWDNDKNGTVHQAATQIGAKFMSCIGLMSLKTAVVTSESAPAKLNSARIKKGKPPISEVVTIRVKKQDRHEFGGTHASPRPHWRRGHVRRLLDGKIVLVSPHPVMGQAKIPTTYKVKS